MSGCYRDNRCLGVIVTIVVISLFWGLNINHRNAIDQNEGGGASSSTTPSSMPETVDPANSPVSEKLI